MSWPDFWSKSATQSWKTALLWPLGKLTCRIAARRLKRFKSQPPQKPTQIKIIVVGNIVVGGTGKTPFIQWLGWLLASKKLRYGIVSRGYGGKTKTWPQLVTATSNPEQVGDEPVLLAKSLQCPVAVSPNRMDAVELLQNHFELDVIISDDGLQHYALPRDIEVVMMDAQRVLGNEYCLPAGPLREPKSRLAKVDFVVWNGADLAEIAAETSTIMKLAPYQFCSVAKPDMVLPPSAFAGESVNAMAGIGNPQRFFETLSDLKVQAKPYPFKDHEAYSEDDFNQFENTKPLLMTEKDAVKCQPFAQANWWYLEVQPECPRKFAEQLIEKLNSL